MKEDIHFAHGNGFPSLCYGQLLQALEKRYCCHYINKIGHDPHFPVTDNWHNLTQEIIASIQRQCQQPVIAIGHSLGGVLSLLAAFRKPQLFKAVILIDSPLPGLFKSFIIRWAKLLGMIDKITPAGRSKNRRSHWQTKEQLYAYLKSRPLFKTFTENCLLDFMKHGTYQTAEGYQLGFDPHIEYLMYRTVPHDLPNYLAPLSIPTALLYGTESSVVKPADVHHMQNHYHIQCFKMPGTHTLPMETPHLVAERLVQIIDRIL